MLARCYNPKNKDFRHYGGRGIVVCDQWRHSFDAFITDMGPRPDGTTLERVDVERGYCPDNCTWASWKQQTRNKRNNHRLTYGGESLCIAEWAERTGIPSRTIWDRIHRGWTAERALTTAVGSSSHRWIKLATQ